MATDIQTTTIMPKREFSASDAIAYACIFIKKNPWFAVKFIFLLTVVQIIYDYFKIVANHTNFSPMEMKKLQPDDSLLDLFLSWSNTIDLPTMAIALIITIPLFFSISTMLFRKALFDIEIGIWGLNLGRDEARSTMARLFVELPSMVSITCLYATELWRPNSGFAMGLGWLGVIVVYICMAWVSLRLCLGQAIVIVEKKFELKRIWLATKQNAWNIFGVGILIALILFLLFLPILGILSLEFNDSASIITNKLSRFVLHISVKEFVSLVAIGTYCSFALLLSTLANISVYKQMNPDFAPISSNSPTEIP